VELDRGLGYGGHATLGVHGNGTSADAPHEAPHEAPLDAPPGPDTASSPAREVLTPGEQMMHTEIMEGMYGTFLAVQEERAASRARSSKARARFRMYHIHNHTKPHRTPKR
jgi:hypothetical protein